MPSGVFVFLEDGEAGVVGEDWHVDEVSEGLDAGGEGDGGLGFFVCLGVVSAVSFELPEVFFVESGASVFPFFESGFEFKHGVIWESHGLSDHGLGFLSVRKAAEVEVSGVALTH